MAEDEREEGPKNKEAPKKTEQANRPSPERTQIREELRDEYDRNLLIRQNVDGAIDTLLRLNPLENIQKKLDEYDGEQDERIQSMMNIWVDMFRDGIEEASTIIPNKLKRAAEIQEEVCEEPVTETSSLREREKGY